MVSIIFHRVNSNRIICISCVCTTCSCTTIVYCYSFTSCIFYCITGNINFVLSICIASCFTTSYCDVSNVCIACYSFLNYTFSGSCTSRCVSNRYFVNCFAWISCISRYCNIFRARFYYNFMF